MQIIYKHSLGKQMFQSDHHYTNNKIYIKSREAKKKQKDPKKSFSVKINKIKRSEETKRNKIFDNFVVFLIQ